MSIEVEVWGPEFTMMTESEGSSTEMSVYGTDLLKMLKKHLYPESDNNGSDQKTKNF